MTAPPAIDADDPDLFDLDADLAEPGSDDDEDLPVRADLGYEPPPAAVAPPKPAKVPALPSYEAARGVCRSCQAGSDVPGGIMLHQPPGRIEHTICGDCLGKRNRDTVEQTREVIRDLKAAAACGNATDERSAMVQLRALVGEHQAGETASAIRERIAEGAKGGRR